MEGDSSDLFNEEMNQTSKVNGLLARRHALISQKNRLTWLKDGDRNSAFFHRLHSTQKSKASIKTIQVGNCFITLDNEIGAHVVAYYERLFAKDQDLSSDYSILNSFSWPTISPNHNLLLRATPSHDEIRSAVFGLEASSSPGPDGLGVFFYHKCWDTISKDVSAAIIHFFTTLEIPNEMNSSLVTLIPSCGFFSSYGLQAYCYGQLFVQDFYKNYSYKTR